MMRRWLVGLSIIYWAITLPWFSTVPFNWDAAQFNIALHHYDVNLHQPHPPGYPLFIVLGKLFGVVLPDNIALTLVAALFGWVSVIMLYLLCYQLSKKNLTAGLISLAWMVNPLFWLNREVALTYTVDAAASITLGYLVFLTMTKRDRQYLIFGALTLGLAGAFRPSLLLLLLPLFIYQASFHRRNWKLLLITSGIIIGLTLLWFIPVVWLTGGLNNYLELSRKLYGSAAADTAWTWNQIKFVGSTLLLSLNLVLVGLGWAVYKIIRGQRSWILFGLAWVCPAWLIYGLIHFGQVGYALVLLPPAYLLLVPLVQRRLSLAGVIIVLNLSIFLLLSPVYAQTNFFPHTRAQVYLQKLARYAPELFKWNYLALQNQSTYLLEVQKLAQHYPADQTLVVTTRNLQYPSPANGLLLRNKDAFREISYILPDYQVVEVSPGRDYALKSFNYVMSSSDHSKLTVANNIRYVIIVTDAFPSEDIPQSIITQPIPVPHTDHFVQLGIMDKPWQFANIAFAREADILGLHDTTR